MSSEDMKSLHDIYEGLVNDEMCQKTIYILQFLWRDLTSNFDVLGPYFTLFSTAEAKHLHPLVTSTIDNKYVNGMRNIIFNPKQRAFEFMT